jgi:hypothetical protein
MRGFIPSLVPYQRLLAIANTSVSQFVPVVTSAVAFVVACFLRWRPVETGNGKEKAANEQPDVEQSEKDIPS